jgi:hypothetical protein
MSVPNLLSVGQRDSIGTPNLYRARAVRRNLITSLPLLVVAIAIVAALAGCGGGGGDSSSTATAAAGGEASGTTTQGESSGSSGKSGSSSGKSGTPPANGPGSSDKPSASSGSGGSSGETGTPSGGLSKSEFVRQANAICEKRKKQSLAKMAAYVKEHKSGSEPANPALIVEAVKAVFLPGVQTQVDEIRALGAPPGDEAKVEAFLAALEEGVEDATEASGAPGAAFGQSFKRSAELAREYGLDGCAYG